MTQKILSVFIDESGDFGPYEKHNPYYLVAMIAHDQNVNLSAEIAKMDNYMLQNGRQIQAIHVGPLIRRESVYENEFVEDRKHLFNVLYNFVRRANIQYMTCVVKKIECSDEVRPIDYKLFQVADMVCTMELLALKAEANGFSHSELEFFDSARAFKRDYLKNIRKKRIDK